MAARWTIDGTLVIVAGPLRIGTRWSVEPVEGDVIRVVAPTALYTAWLDGRVLRERGGRIIGLAIDGGRARRLVFRRADYSNAGRPLQYVFRVENRRSQVETYPRLM